MERSIAILIACVYLFANVATAQVPAVGQTATPSPAPVPAAAPAQATPDLSMATSILQQVSTTPEAASAQDTAAEAAYQAALQQNQAPNIIRGLLELCRNYPASPKSSEACMQIAKFSEMINRFDLSVMAYQAYIKRRPQSPDALQALLRLGDALRKTGKHDEAVQCYQQVIQRDTAQQMALVAQDGMAQSLMAQKKYKEAVDQLEALLKNLRSVYGEDLRGYSNLSVVLLNEGLCLEELGRNREAMRRYGELRKILPQSREAELAQSRLEDLSRPLFSGRPAASPVNAVTPSVAPPAGPNPGMRNHFEGQAPAGSSTYSTGATVVH